MISQTTHAYRIRIAVAQLARYVCETRIRIARALRYSSIISRCLRDVYSVSHTHRGPGDVYAMYRMCISEGDMYATHRIYIAATVTADTMYMRYITHGDLGRDMYALSMRYATICVVNAIRIRHVAYASHVACASYTERMEITRDTYTTYRICISGAICMRYRHDMRCQCDTYTT
jgi:hypothetical protein